MDADTILPSRFIEENLKTGARCVGKAGCAMLLDMSCFIKVFGGKFAEIGAEDSDILYKLLSQRLLLNLGVITQNRKEKAASHIPGGIF